MERLNLRFFLNKYVTGVATNNVALPRRFFNPFRNSRKKFYRIFVGQLVFGLAYVILIYRSFLCLSRSKN